MRRITHSATQRLQFVECLYVLLLLFDVDFVILALLFKEMQSKQPNQFILFLELDVTNAYDYEVLRERLDEDERGLKVHPRILQLCNENEADLEEDGGDDEAIAEEKLKILLIQLPLDIPL